MLGDVAISLDTAYREAGEVNLTPSARFDQLMIHGILHLFGFDHEKTEKDAQTMIQKEEALLNLLSIKEVDC